MSASSTPRRKPGFPGSLTDLHRFRKTAHGHDGSSRIVMVRKTDRRTIASIQNGQEPKLETITRETIETFRGERTECKVTTEKTDLEDNCPPGIFDGLTRKSNKKKTITLVRNKANSKMDFANECLDAHNELRKKHGVAPLKLSRDICKVSQDWANNLIRKANLMHSNNRDYGENLFAIQSSNPNFSISGKEAVQNWYDEIKVHKFGVEPSSLASGHFTQVIWKDSKELGIAFAKSGGKIIVVANYFPAGNVLGTFAKNVPPLTTSNNNNNSTPDLSSALGNLSLSQSQISSKITDGNFEQDFLQAHNSYREKHGVLPLSLDPKLCKYSQEWAKHLASKNILEHRPGSNYGENIYCLYTSDPNYKVNGNAPVDSWYEEISEHPFGKEPSSLKSGHFTQVVWKDSKTLGVGVAKNSQGSIYVVANYHPAGNFVGHFVENVLPLRRSGGMAENLAAKPVAAASGKFTQFAVDALNVHNEYRKRHGVGAMVLTEELCKVAQNWADTCAKEASLTHRANNSYGENIFCVYSSDYDHTPSARDAVKEWYDEVKKHTFGVEKVNQATLHFTQVIWKDSTQLGVGIAKNKKGQTYVVANYNPRGNFIGQFVANVPRAKA